jgi:hypothetical protein
MEEINNDGLLVRGAAPLVDYETIDITDKIIEEDEQNASPPKPFTRKKSAAPNFDNRVDDPNHWNLIFITNNRNSLLQQTDKYVLPDFNITPEKLEIIKNYRQMLRDFININKDLILSGEIVELPQIPI